MIGLDPKVGANLAFIWMINPRVLLHSEPNIGFDLSYFSFHCKFYTFRFFFLFLHSIFLIFYPRMNKSYMHTNITLISSFQNGFNHPFTSTDFYIKSKVVEGIHEI